MATFYLSPLVNVITTDDPSLYVPAVATAIGATVGDFAWGPIGQAIAVSDEQFLFQNFGKPTNRNYKDWYSARNFLDYSQSLRVVRTANIAGTGVLPAVWQDATLRPLGYNIGESVVPVLLTQPTKPYRFRVQSTTGVAPHISGVTEPVWPTGLGATVVDGDLTWVNIGPLNGRPTNASDVDNNSDAEPFKVIKNSTDWDALEGTRGTGCAGNYIAKYPGVYGNKISVAVRDGKTHTPNAWTATTPVIINSERVPVLATQVTSPYRFEAIVAGTTGAAEPVWPATLGGTVVDGTVTWKNIGTLQSSWSQWEYSRLFPFQPEQAIGSRDEIAVVVLLDGVAVETFIGDAIPGRLDASGVPNYIATIINRSSRYIYFNEERALLGFVTGVTSFFTPNYGRPVTLKSGLDGDKPSDDDYIESWRESFSDAETVDINLAFLGGASTNVGKYLVQSVAETRKDTVAFVSPAESDVVGLPAAQVLINLLNLRTGLAGAYNFTSSYGFMDGSYKYQYDSYNDKFRWIPLNGDIAGLAARSDDLTAAWFSPAGFNRGILKNVIKLAWNPTRVQRDDMYTQCINSVITTRGEGSLLYGDRTMLKRPTAFQALNVRRLFIVLAKSIATASKYVIFEFNDDVTRNRFTQLVTPFLRDVQSRRGIKEDKPGRPGFQVFADERINTPEVQDRQEFKAKILVRPNKAINFIEIEIVATKTGAIFEELIPELSQNVNF